MVHDRWTSDAERALEANLSPDEAALVRRVLKGTGTRSLAVKLRSWRLLVEDIAAGVDLDEQYAHDFEQFMFSRDNIEKVLENADEPLRQKVLSVLAPINAMYQDATVPITDPEDVNPYAVPGHWWWYRSPRRRSSDDSDSVRSAAES